jgi:Fe-S cluster assembly ATP-binding protein
MRSWDPTAPENRRWPSDHGTPKYTIESGEIRLDDVLLNDKTVDERSRMGLFLGMQNPVEVPGVTNFDFVRAAVQAHLPPGQHLRLGKFILSLEDAAKELKMGSGLAHRHLNEGFSGGEKKRNEILQMKLLRPKIALLDEIDSGLDVDALRIVGENVTAMKSPELGMILITHYQRLLDVIVPDVVHIILQGRIFKTAEGTDCEDRCGRLRLAESRTGTGNMGRTRENARFSGNLCYEKTRSPERMKA